MAKITSRRTHAANKELHVQILNTKRNFQQRVQWPDGNKRRNYWLHSMQQFSPAGQFECFLVIRNLLAIEIERDMRFLYFHFSPCYLFGIYGTISLSIFTAIDSLYSVNYNNEISM
jgi:hypothetical protein